MSFHRIQHLQASTSLGSRAHTGHASSSGSEMDRLRQAGLEISKGTDVKADMLAKTHNKVKWQSFIETAPLAITLLGELNLIATKKDFPLNRSPPKEGYKHMRHPDSFRATMCQISNAGFCAFNEAHKNMDMIKMLSGNAQGHLATTVRMIVGGSSQEIKSLLPVELESVGSIAEECTQLASSTEKQFADAMHLISEVFEAMQKAKGVYQDDLSDAYVAKRVTEKHAEFADQRKQQLKDEMQGFKKTMDEAEAGYRKAMKSAPGAGKLFMLALGDAFTGAISAIPNILGNVSKNGYPKMRFQPGRGQMESIDTSELCSILEGLSLFVEQIVILTTDSKATVTDEELSEIKASRQHFEYALKKVNALKPNSLNGEAIRVLQNLVKLADSIIQNKSQNCLQANDKNEPDLTKLAQDTRKMYKTLRVKLSAENDLSHHQLFGTLPQMSKQDATGSKSLTKAVQQDYRFRVEMEMQKLRDAREAYMMSSEKFDKQSKELAELVGNLAKINIQTINFEEICKTLRKGLQAMSIIRSQWAKVLAFFQGISAIVKCHMQHNMQHFVRSVQSASNDLALPGYDRRMLDSLYQHAFTASGYAHIVEHISSLYTEVSENYIMNDVADLGILLAYDPEKDQHLIQAKLLELGQKSKSTQMTIRRLVIEKERGLTTSIDARLEHIDTVFTAALPPPSAEEESENAEVLSTAQTHVEERAAEATGLNVDHWF